MRASTARLQQMLQGQQIIRCNLFTLRLIGGATYHWTDGDVDVYSAGRLFGSDGPSISGAKYHLMRGIQVDTLDLTVTVQESDAILDLPWEIAVRSGALDAATITIERAFMPAWGESPEVLLIFKGEVTELSAVEQTIQMSVKSDASKLDTKIPLEVFQPGCRNRLFTGGCTVSRSDNSRPGSVINASNRFELSTSLDMPDGFFSLGDILFSTGNNAGVRRSIKSYSQANGLIVLSTPLSFNVQAGDVFVVAAGCDKTRGAGGCSKFGAGVELRFNGTPYVPPPESIV